MALLAVTAGLFSLLVREVFAPVRFPRTHLVVLSGNEYDPLAAPAIAFRRNQIEAFRVVEPKLFREKSEAEEDSPEPPIGRVEVIDALSDRRAARRLGLRLGRLGAAVDDVLILSVTAHAAWEGGELVLLSGEHASPGDGTGIPLKDLLDQVAGSPFAEKVLLLDIGRRTPDPAAGVLTSGAVDEVRRLVRATGDPSVWVLSANRDGEVSRLAEGLGLSAFDWFAARGLDGASDVDGDQAIALHELSDYVAANVAAWAEQSTGGQATQTPLLCWGGGSTEGRLAFPVLISAEVLESESPSGDGSETAGEDHKDDGVDAEIESAIAANTAGGAGAEVYSLALSELAAAGGVGSAAELSAAVLGPDAEGAEPPPPAAPVGEGETQGEAAESPADSNGEPGEQAGTEQGESDADQNGVAEPGAGDSSEEAPQETPPTDAAPSPDDPPKRGRDPLKLRASRLLADAWTLRDQLSSEVAGLRPLERMPLRWRGLNDSLLSYEWAVRYGSPGELRKAVSGLRGLLREWRGFDPRSNAAATAEFGDAFRPASLALCELLHDQGMSSTALIGTEAIDAFDAALQQGDPSALRAWLAEPGSQRGGWYVESDLALRLLDTGAEWRTVRLLLTTRRAGERAATRFGASRWAAEEVRLADLDLQQAEQLVLDGLAADRDAAAIALAERAAERYRSAEAVMAVIADAQREARRQSSSLPRYAAWLRRLGDLNPVEQEVAADLHRIAELLSELNAALDSPSVSGVDQVERPLMELRKRAQRVRLGFSAGAVLELISPPHLGTEAWRAESWLSTPLIGSPSRLALLASAPGFARESARRFRPPMVAAAPNSAGTRGTHATSMEVNRLELAIARLCAECLGQAAEAAQSLDGLLGLLTREYDEPSGALTASTVELESQTRFDQSLRDFYVAASESLAAEATGSDTHDESADARLERVAACGRALVTLPLDLIPEGTADRVLGRRFRAEWLGLLAWQRTRLLSRRYLAAGEAEQSLLASAEGYRMASNRLDWDAPIPPLPEPALRASGPQSLSLAAKPQEVVEFSFVQNTVGGERGTTHPLWVSVDYDPALLELRSDGLTPVYSKPGGYGLLSDDTAAGATAGDRAAGPRLAPVHWNPGTAGPPPTFELRQGLPDKLRLIVRKKPGASGDTKLIVSMHGPETTPRLETRVSLVASQFVDLRFIGPNKSSTGQQGAVLHPYPNRATEYQLQLRSLSAQPRKLRTTLYSLSRDYHSGTTSLVAPDGLRRMLRRWSGVAVASADEHESQPHSGWEQIKLAGQAADPETPAPLSATLLAVCTDLDSGLSQVTPVRLAPQSPRRLVDVAVRYESTQRRVYFTGRLADPATAPDGPVKLSVQLADARYRELPTRGRLQGEIGPDAPAELFVDAASYDGSTVQAFVDVDGSPRVLIYRIDCDPVSPRVEEVTQAMSVRMSAPADRSVFGRPLESVPVRLQVDAPVSAFSSGGAVLELGFDPERDRTLTGNAPLLLSDSRDVDASLSKVTEEGALEIATTVSDIETTLPAGGLADGRVGVMAKLRVGGAVAWSNPVDIMVDGGVPKFVSVGVSPPEAVAVGETLAVAARVSDGGMSGVAQVEAALDTTGVGEFGEKTPAVLATKDSLGIWRAEFPISDKVPPGTHSVLLRATDRAGNATAVKRTFVRVMTAEAAAERLAQQTNRVTGIVTYDEEPVGDATIAVVDAEGAVLAEQKTSANGRFVFPEIRVGDYSVMAEGLARNKVRRAEAPVTVTAKPARVSPLDLQLR